MMAYESVMERNARSWVGMPKPTDFSNLSQEEIQEEFNRVIRQMRSLGPPIERAKQALQELTDIYETLWKKKKALQQLIMPILKTPSQEKKSKLFNGISNSDIELLRSLSKDEKEAIRNELKNGKREEPKSETMDQTK